jgi:hypothetical protein
MDSPKEEEKGIQVWDVSQWLFTNPLEELAHKKKGGGEVMYADIDEGKIISFRKKGSGVTNTEFTAFEFKDREEIPDEVLDAAVCLDELIHKPTYEEVATAFDKKQEEEAPPAKKEVVKKEKEEEAPPAKKSLQKKEADIPPDKGEEALECPGGAAFGTDYNEYDECRECELRKQCSDKKDELSAPTPKKKVLTRREKS